MCFHQKYRTQDDTCNNLQQPKWGASATAFEQLLKPAYKDGFNFPLGSREHTSDNQHPLPLARLVSTTVMRSEMVTLENQFTKMLMQWGQLLTYNVVRSVAAISNSRFSDGAHCSEVCTEDPSSFSILIPENDPFAWGKRCMPLMRSSPVCGSSMASLFINSVLPREQMNHLTSYIDASNVYGSTDHESQQLRDLTIKAFLRKGDAAPGSGKPLMPFAMSHPQSVEFRLFREHNRIAAKLLPLNTKWNSNTTYHEARKQDFGAIPEGQLPLQKAVSLFWIIREGGIYLILCGLFGRVSTEQLSPVLTEQLFATTRAVNLDLIALNIQRGRDHGIPPYKDYRVVCNLISAQNFEDLRNENKNPEI
ncbi:PXDN protein, partial [Polyodon spathula]|nr:PXDN protein [Polyodon spathula]